MTMSAEAVRLSTTSEYLALTPERRYEATSQQFPEWLLAEPIQFPRHDPTFGWACRVDGCEAALSPTDTSLLCSQHVKKFRQVKDEVGIEEFVLSAQPSGAHRLGWALTRKPDCPICGANREVAQLGHCTRHSDLLRQARHRGDTERQWRESQVPLPPIPRCSVPECVHDGELCAHVGDASHRICRTHRGQLVESAGGNRVDSLQWESWLTGNSVRESVSQPTSRGVVSLNALPPALQNEIRYGLHRHRKTPRRTHWRPTELQAVVDALAVAKVASLNDAAVAEISQRFPRGSLKRRILLDLPFAARGLMVNEDAAKDAGWFDPIIVGSNPFPGTQGSQNRRKPWDLTMVTQRWLRDLLWDHLRESSLQPTGKQPSAGTVFNRISGIILLSCILRRNRTDHGDDPHLIGAGDAKAVKETWDLWFREQLPIPRMSADTNTVQISTLTQRSRHIYMSSIRIVLAESRKRHLTPPELDPFILNLPEYPRPAHNPRPRPMTYDDFQKLVSPDTLAALDARDHENAGLVDLWLTQAFQGGRISETLKLRLGCVGLVGRAQPYLWRDITKTGIVDYGMPCHLPVYERLLRRRETTIQRLRERYSDQLATLDHRGRTQLEATWDRTMPLFPGTTQNPDLHIEVSQSWFRDLWTEWLESLGLSGITTHQTRATLATSLLNNGAPPELVRQLLGHFSHEALAHYASYSNAAVVKELQKVWVAGPGVDKPGQILLRPNDINAESPAAADVRIDLSIVPVEHGLCRYGPVVGGAGCPWEKNCTDSPTGPCEHFVLTGADLAYWERKRDAAYHFAEGAPNDAARDYILTQWHPWEAALSGLRDALDELGLLKAAEDLDLRSPIHDYFAPLFTNAFPLEQLTSRSYIDDEDRT